MPKRNMTDLNNLRQSLELQNKSKPKHLVLCGDFNCPDIDWDKLCLKHSKTTQDRNEQQHLIEIMSDFNLSQMHSEPTREENLLDLVFATNPSLIKSTANAPGIMFYFSFYVTAMLKMYLSKWGRSGLVVKHRILELEVQGSNPTTTV